MGKLGVLLLLGLSPALAAAQNPPPVNLTVRSHIVLPSTNVTVVAHDQLVFLSHWDAASDNTLYIWDASDPALPVLLSATNQPGYGHGDVHSMYYSNGILYMGFEWGTHSMRILDVSDPAAPREIATIDLADHSHNIRLDGTTLWIARNFHTSGPELVSYDVSDPARPVPLGQMELGAPTTGFCHDLSVMDGRAWLSAWDDGVIVADFQDPRLPVAIGSAGSLPRSTHSTWPSPDLRTIYTGHEDWDLGYFAWDPSTTPWTRRWNYQSHATSFARSMAHDVVAVGGFVYLAYYTEGYRILDVRDPANPIEVASLVTESGCASQPIFCSIWAHAVDSGRIYIGDTQNGLWIADFDLPHDHGLVLYAARSAGGVAFTWNHTGEHQYKVRRNERRDTPFASRVTDVDARTRWSDPGVLGDGKSWYYRINGPWQ